MGLVISCIGHLHSNSWRANLFKVRPLIINSFYFPHFKAALMLFKVRSLFGVLGYIAAEGVRYEECDRYLLFCFERVDHHIHCSERWYVAAVDSVYPHMAGVPCSRFEFIVWDA